MQLRECFFKLKWPELRLLGSAEQREVITFNRDIIVNNHLSWFSSNEKFHFIDSSSVLLLGQENLFDLVWELRQPTQCCQEVAIIQIPLYHISKLDIMGKHFITEFTCSLPLRLPEFTYSVATDRLLGG